MKKKSSLLHKLLYFVNSIVAAILLFSYLLPYISPKTIPQLATFSTLVPVFIIINTLFFVYWLVKLKKTFILSGLVLLIGYFVSTPFVKFSGKDIVLTEDLKVISYNVRAFNMYKWNDDITTEQKIYDFINTQNPDVLAIQEFYNSKLLNIKLPYKYIKTKGRRGKFGLAIYSKYPIVNSGSLDFERSNNNTIFVDIVKKDDTIRVYNVHLESIKINKDKVNFGENNSSDFILKIENAFEKQVDQTELIIKHEYSWKGKKVFCGDLNNTAFSWVYRNLAKNKKDAYAEAGLGLGKSFRYIYPLRIDFILVDTSATVNSYKTLNNIKLSDHYPIEARIKWQ